jgi:hypothetical protein
MFLNMFDQQRNASNFKFARLHLSLLVAAKIHIDHTPKKADNLGVWSRD